MAVSAGVAVVPASELATARAEIAKLQRVLGKSPQSTFVVIDEVDTDNWGWGGENVTTLRQREAAGKEGA